MNIFLAGFSFIICALLIGAILLRWSDHKADAAERSRLIKFQPTAPALFDPAMIKELPEPARRYFLFTIEAGTPLYTVADIIMDGQFSLGTKNKPDYMAMEAQQTLSSPQGFVWEMSASRGLMSISGSDSGAWTRFRLLGLIPVARMGGGTDHARSAFGRYVAEAVFWTPAALLPRSGIVWEKVDDNTARVIVTHNELTQRVELTVDDFGRPCTVKFLRWSNTNPKKIHRLQLFGGYLSEFRKFSGFTLPSRVEAGNYFESDEYFPFFVAEVKDIQFPVKPVY